MDHTHIRFEDMNWSNLAHVYVHWQASEHGN